MSLLKWAFIVVLLLPVAEIAVFILLALSIGWLWTFALFLATSLIGVLLLRRSGRAKLNQFGAALAQDGVRAIHVESPGLAPMLGGILLVFPGFITDVLGAMLFVPALRRWAGATIGRAWHERQRAPGAPAIIDLAPDQWDELPGGKIEHRRRRKKPP
jgi:UPF0716 family protein affecting phage T7 exclusion